MPTDDDALSTTVAARPATGGRARRPWAAASEHRQRPLAAPAAGTPRSRSARSGSVEHAIARRDDLLQVVEPRGLGNRDHAGLRQHEGQRELRRARAYAAAPARPGSRSARRLPCPSGEYAMTSMPCSATQGQQRPFDRRARPGGRGPGWRRSGRPRAARAARACRRRRSWRRPTRGSCRRRAAARRRRRSPRAGCARASAAGRDRAHRRAAARRLRSHAAIALLRAGVVRIHLADQHDVVAPAARDRLADDLLGHAFAVHLGGVDHRRPRSSPACSAFTSALRSRGRSPMRHVPRPSLGRRVSDIGEGLSRGRPRRIARGLPPRHPPMPYDPFAAPVAGRHVVRGACPHDCPDTCAMLVTVEDGRAVEVRGNPDHPPTQGVLCTKVARYLDRTYSPQRVLHPMKRVGRKGEGRFERIGWDEALDTIADAFCGAGPRARRRIDPALQLRRHDGAAAVRLDGPALLPSPGRLAARPHDLRVGGQGRLDGRRSARPIGMDVERFADEQADPGLGQQRRSPRTCTSGRARRKRSGAARR